MLSDLEDKTGQEEAALRLDIEMEQAKLQDMGKTSKEMMLESLDQFGKCDEFAEMDDIVVGMMARSEENKQETRRDQQARQSKIHKQMEQVAKRYGR